MFAGFSLCYRPLQLIDDDRATMLYQRTSVALQARFWRLLVPSGLAAAVSLVMAHLGAFNHSKTVCRAFNDTTPNPGNIFSDVWLWAKDTFVDMWVLGKHHFHDSLWCMKILLLGSYLMYLLVIMRVEPRHKMWLWVLIGCSLLTPAVAEIGALDLAGFVFGGVIANVEVELAKSEDKDKPSSWKLLHQLGWSAAFVFFLFLGTYPSGAQTPPLCIKLRLHVACLAYSLACTVMKCCWPVCSLLLCLAV